MKVENSVYSAALASAIKAHEAASDVEVSRVEISPAKEGAIVLFVTRHPKRGIRKVEYTYTSKDNHCSSGKEDL